MFQAAMLQVPVAYILQNEIFNAELLFIAPSSTIADIFFHSHHSRQWLELGCLEWVLLVANQQLHPLLKQSLLLTSLSR